MDELSEQWRGVDEYFLEALIDEDAALQAARQDCRAANLPEIEVAANQGALLAMLARLSGARRVLEIGTLGGYSTIWLARAVEQVMTLELQPEYAKVARRNLDRAGVGERVEIMIGPAAESLAALIEGQVEPYDLVFIDADKPNNPRYLEASLRLVRPGSVIIVDNVVRGGAVVNAASTDDRVHGVRQLIEMVRADPRLEATALQTVGSKGWDGFAMIRVR
ncbi:MAG TPA: O-methyltransferase [Kineosporiaceae bacterium]|nr:O-methyltransferase [Kineosporiaceae bacterium]